MISKDLRFRRVVGLVVLVVAICVSRFGCVWARFLQFVLCVCKVQFLCMSCGQWAFVSVGLLSYVTGGLWVSWESFAKLWMMKCVLQCISGWLMVWAVNIGGFKLLCIMYAVSYDINIHGLK
jgi:hypothetical protein